VNAPRQRPTQSIATATGDAIRSGQSAHTCGQADAAKRTLERAVGNGVELATSQAFALCIAANNWIPQ
jgi:hypothetical protein